MVPHVVAGIHAPGPLASTRAPASPCMVHKASNADAQQATEDNTAKTTTPVVQTRAIAVLHACIRKDRYETRWWESHPGVISFKRK